MTTDKTAPDRKLTILVDAKPVDLFMSYGVLEKLLQAFPPETTPVENAMMTTEGRKSVFDLVLKKRGAYGVESFDPETNDIEVEDVEKLFRWVGMHVADFFLRYAENAKAIMDRSQARLTSLTPSPSGSPS